MCFFLISRLLGMTISYLKFEEQTKFLSSFIIVDKASDLNKTRYVRAWMRLTQCHWSRNMRLHRRSRAQAQISSWTGQATPIVPPRQNGINNRETRTSRIGLKIAGIRWNYAFIFLAVKSKSPKFKRRAVGPTLETICKWHALKRCQRPPCSTLLLWWCRGSLNLEAH